jgi:hypothetical protein
MWCTKEGGGLCSLNNRQPACIASGKATCQAGAAFWTGLGLARLVEAKASTARVKPHVTRRRPVIAETGHVKQKIVHGVGDSNGIKRNHTRRDYLRLVDIALPLAVLLGNAFFLQFRGIYEVVAKQTAAL